MTSSTSSLVRGVQFNSDDIGIKLNAHSGLFGLILDFSLYLYPFKGRKNPLHFQGRKELVFFSRLQRTFEIVTFTYVRFVYWQGHRKRINYIKLQFPTFKLFPCFENDRGIDIGTPLEWTRNCVTGRYIQWRNFRVASTALNLYLFSKHCSAAKCQKHQARQENLHLGRVHLANCSWNNCSKLKYRCADACHVMKRCIRITRPRDDSMWCSRALFGNDPVLLAFFPMGLLLIIGRRTSTTDINRKWTFCINGQWFG